MANGNGNGNSFKGIIYVAVFIMIALTILPLINSRVRTSTIESASDFLTGQGYVVLAAGEYGNLNDKLDAIKTSADLAVTNAEAAVVAAQVAAAKVDLFNSAERHVFPETTATTVTLTAGGVANTFGAWAEIADSGATTLSASFVADAGYLSELTPFLYSVANKSYLIEIAYGVAYTNIARLRWYARADELVVLPIYSAKIPAGETVYCRMMCETAGATVRIGLRYFYE